MWIGALGFCVVTLLLRNVKFSTAKSTPINYLTIPVEIPTQI